jgi:hypothetical protein
LPLKTSLNETCAAHFVGPGMPEEECAGQRHARILTVAAYLQQDPRGNRAGLAFAGSPMDRLPARQIAPLAVRMVAHVVIGLDPVTPVKARQRAEQAPSREEVAQRATVIPFAQTFEAPHVRFQERHNSATAIIRETQIGARQTQDLRGRPRCNGSHAGWLVLGERIRDF